ncbi:hypothetical protein HJC23_010404 [Cyclotella cryptica]|uniref:Uncharacterized protein n=1 Tax=Cyclotella cryptica TaxID=29204 RepID=A0ABD3QIQ8_9STRA
MVSLPSPCGSGAHTLDVPLSFQDWALPIQLGLLLQSLCSPLAKLLFNMAGCCLLLLHQGDSSLPQSPLPVVGSYIMERAKRPSPPSGESVPKCMWYGPNPGTPPPPTQLFNDLVVKHEGHKADDTEIPFDI